MPDDYIRKQTLVNAERFITPELKELEEQIVSAEERRGPGVRSCSPRCASSSPRPGQRLLQTAATDLAQLDVLACLAEVGRAPPLLPAA